MWNAKLAGCLILLLSATSDLIAQRTLYVDCAQAACPGNGTPEDPFCTIQEGIDAAQDGDTVLVAECLYEENIDFLGKRIRVMSSGRTEATIVRGVDQAPVVTFRSGEPPSTLLSGFTLRNGWGSAETGGRVYFGGGVLCANNSSPTLANNTITRSGGHVGGGVACLASSPAVIGNEISQNWATPYCHQPCGYYDCCGYSFGFGAALYSDLESAPLVWKNLIESNFVSVSAVHTRGPAVIHENELRDHDGWPIYCWDSQVTNNRVVYNRSSGIFALRSVVEGNIVTSNVADSMLGAIQARDSLVRNNFVSGNLSQRNGIVGIRAAGSDLISNMIVRNRSPDSRSMAIRAVGSRLLNNTISGNTLHPEAFAVHFSGTSVINCIIWGNGGRSISPFKSGEPNIVGYSCIEGGYSGFGNFGNNPLFVGANDFQLRCVSPCVDAGSQRQFAELPRFDALGQDRRRIGRIDIGADEFGTIWHVSGDLTPGGSMRFFATTSPTHPEPSISEVYLSLSDSGADPGIAVPHGGGRHLDLSADSLFVQWLGLHTYRQVSPLRGCQGAATAPFQIPLGTPVGLSVYYAGVTWDLNNREVTSVSSTRFFEIR